MPSAPQIGAESTANEPVATRAVGRAPRMTPIPSTHGSPVIGASQSQTSTPAAFPLHWEILFLIVFLNSWSYTSRAFEPDSPANWGCSSDLENHVLGHIVMPLEKSIWVNGNTKSIFRFLPAIVQSATKMALQLHWVSVNRHPGYWQRLAIE